MNYPLNQQEQYQSNVNMTDGYNGHGNSSMPMRGSVQSGGILGLGKDPASNKMMNGLFNGIIGGTTNMASDVLNNGSKTNILTGLAGNVMGSNPLVGGLASSVISNPSAMLGLAAPALKSNGGKAMMGGILGGLF